jgi:signal transduction histidine kinase
MVSLAVSDQLLGLLDEPAAVVAHDSGTVVGVNERFAALLRRDSASLIGAALSRLVGGEDAPRLAVANAAAEPSEVTVHLAADDIGPATAFTCRFGPARAGHRLLRLSPVQAAGSGHETDPYTRDLERRVQELRQKLTWFREAIDKVGHSVVIFDKQGRLVLCNKFYRDGYRSGDRVLPPEIPLEGKTYRELMELRVRYKLHKEFAGDPEGFIEDRVRRFERGEDCITDLASGHVVRSQYRRLTDGIRVYIGTDITELVEKEQRHRATELAYRTKSQFLANMSHELRTPLNAILGFSQLIRDATAGPVDARYRSFAEDIHGAGQHLLKLINDILDLSKIEVGRMELRESAVDVGEVVRNCCRLLHERAREDHLALEQDIPVGIPCLLADELRLKQVLLNLLSNAIKFTPSGGRVRVAAASRADGGLDLVVADTGVGMSPEDIDTALTPFQQVERGFGRSYDGTGLGLPLAKTLAELHGAHFDIQSTPGVGTVVTIAMPPERSLSSCPWLARGGAV